jgi:hypothetical protein
LFDSTSDFPEYLPRRRKTADGEPVKPPIRMELGRSFHATAEPPRCG